VLCRLNGVHGSNLRAVSFDLFQNAPARDVTLSAADVESRLGSGDARAPVPLQPALMAKLRPLALPGTTGPRVVQPVAGAVPGMTSQPGAATEAVEAVATQQPGVRKKRALPASSHAGAAAWPEAQRLQITVPDTNLGSCVPVSGTCGAPVAPTQPQMWQAQPSAVVASPQPQADSLLGKRPRHAAE
jgi:hypothetical protein